jgi:transposase-like protein
MSLQIIPTDKTDVTKIVCPACGERVKQIGLRKGSIIEGLSFKCKKCGTYWEVKTTKDEKEAKDLRDN